jgi:hypothetical protein
MCIGSVRLNPILAIVIVSEITVLTLAKASENHIRWIAQFALRRARTLDRVIGYLGSSSETELESEPHSPAHNVKRIDVRFGCAFASLRRRLVSHETNASRAALSSLRDFALRLLMARAIAEHWSEFDLAGVEDRDSRTQMVIMYRVADVELIRPRSV